MNDEQARDRTKVSHMQVHAAISRLTEAGYHGCAEEVTILLECYVRESAENSRLKGVIELATTTLWQGNEKTALDLLQEEYERVSTVPAKADASPNTATEKDNQERCRHIGNTWTAGGQTYCDDCGIEVL